MNALRPSYDTQSRARLLALSLLTGLAAALLAVVWLRRAGGTESGIAPAPPPAAAAAPAAPKPTGLSARIPPSFRALTLAVDPISGVGGFAQPGDHVDILATDDRPGERAVARVVLQDVLLLALGARKSGADPSKTDEARTDESKAGEAKAADLTSATVQVTPWQGERLALAAARGHLTLALRPYGDRDQVALPPEWAAPEPPEPAGTGLTTAKQSPIKQSAMEQSMILPKRTAPAPPRPQPAAPPPAPKEAAVVIIRGTETQTVRVAP